MTEKKSKPTPSSKKVETPTDVVNELQSGSENIQGFTQLMRRILKAQDNLEVVEDENPVNRVKGGTPLPAGKRTGPKTPITGTKESDSGN